VKTLAMPSLKGKHLAVADAPNCESRASGQYRFTDTFVKRGGRWRCVASQGTKIVKK